MNKDFYDICYKIMSNYLNFPDVADTYKSILDGISHCKNYPKTMTDFYKKQNDIIKYITEVRKDNIIDAYTSGQNPLMLIPTPLWKPLSQASPEELYSNLEQEIYRLIAKGIHQVIKHFNQVDDNILTAELLQEDVNTLNRYNIRGNTNGQT